MDKVIFAKFSRERKEEFQLSTIIGQFDHQKVVRKNALNPVAIPHIRQLKDNEKKLRQIYDSATLQICPATYLSATCVEFPYLIGITMEKEITVAIEQENFEAVYRTVQRYWQILNRAKDLEEFHSTEEFLKIFGNPSLPQGMKASHCSNLDMMFGNLLKQDNYWLIDYEWVFDFPIPIQYIFARSLMLFGAIQKLNPSQIHELYAIGGVREEDLAVYYQMEVSFQQYVSGENEKTVLSHLYPRMKRETYYLKDWDPVNLYNRITLSTEDGMELFRKNLLNDEVDETILIQNTKEYTRLYFRPADTNCVIRIYGIWNQNDNPVPYESHADLIEGEVHYFIAAPKLSIENRSYTKLRISYEIVYRNNGMIGPNVNVKTAYNQRYEQLLQELEEKQVVIEQHVNMVNEAYARIQDETDIINQQRLELEAQKQKIEELENALKEAEDRFEGMLETKIRHKITKITKR